MVACVIVGIATQYVEDDAPIQLPDSASGQGFNRPLVIASPVSPKASARESRVRGFFIDAACLAMGHLAPVYCLYGVSLFDGWTQASPASPIV